MRESVPRAGAVTLCVLLWARPGTEADLIAYEDQVLGIAAGYRGQVLQRARSNGADGQPLEVQLLEFPSAQAVTEFMADGRRLPIRTMTSPAPNGVLRFVPASAKAEKKSKVEDAASHKVSAARQQLRQQWMEV